MAVHVAPEDCVPVIDRDQDGADDEGVEQPPAQHRPLKCHPQTVSHTEANPEPPHLVSASSYRLKGIGGQRAESADFVSYLLFDLAHTTALIELGCADAQKEWARIERFLAGT